MPNNPYFYAKLSRILNQPKAHYLIVLGGPTASGKTRVAIELARHFHTEIISADSRQLFREMRIGTAVPDPEELAAAPHHLIQTHSVSEQYSVGDYVREVLPLLDRLFQSHNPLILAGGSGLYLQAVCRGLDAFPEVPEEVRQQLQADYQQHGLTYLQSELARLDPDYWQEVDQQNPVRLLRALEVCRTAGRPYSSFRSGEPKARNFRPIYIRLAPDREQLYERIDQRVDHMLAAGLESEARELYHLRHHTAMQTVGYQEFFSHFAGEYDRDEAIRLIKRNSRRFAKRQETWFRKNGLYHPFAPDDVQGMIRYVSHLMGEGGL